MFALLWQSAEINEAAWKEQEVTPEPSPLRMDAEKKSMDGERKNVDKLARTRNKCVCVNIFVVRVYPAKVSDGVQAQISGPQDT